MNDQELVTKDEAPLVAQPVDTSPGGLLAIAVQQGADIEHLKMLLELKREYEADEARKAYHAAVAAFKKCPPTVVKDKVNAQYGSMYVSESALINTVSIALSPHGLTTHFEFNEEENGQRSVTCIMTHCAGHRESVKLSGPLDQSGKKNDLQKIKSTNTYLKVATFEAITGVSSQIGSTDDDANSATQEQVEYISEEQAATLHSMLEEAEKSEGEFLKYYNKKAKVNISRIQGIDAGWYDWSVRTIEGAKK